MTAPYRAVLSIEDAKKQKAIESAVMILLYEKDCETYIVLTERTVYKGKHSGQISFPGGKKDITDENLMQTALRETSEEIGINTNEIEVLTALTHLHIPISNFLVFPYVGVLKNKPNFIKQEKEVAKILEVKISDLLDENNIGVKQVLFKSKNIQFKAPSYNVNNVEVWGATAMILSEFLYILQNG